MEPFGAKILSAVMFLYDTIITLDFQKVILPACRHGFGMPLLAQFSLVRFSVERIWSASLITANSHLRVAHYCIFSEACDYTI